MKALITFFISLFLLPTWGSEWTVEQKQLAGIYLAAHVIDWGQTRTIAKTPYLREYNPILGKKPSLSRVNTYALVTPIVGYLFLDSLPSESRTTWLKALVVFEVAIISRNAYLGIKTDF